jgi:hypothetical protein
VDTWLDQPSALVAVIGYINSVAAYILCSLGSSTKPFLQVHFYVWSRVTGARDPPSKPAGRAAGGRAVVCTSLSAHSSYSASCSIPGSAIYG